MSEFDTKIGNLKNMSFIDQVTWLQDKGFVTQGDQEKITGLWYKYKNEPFTCSHGLTSIKMKLQNILQKRFDLILEIFE